ncbi:MAG: lipid A-modifier LpxR family protein, partial [Gammaproteobacteria bacterium]
MVLIYFNKIKFDWLFEKTLLFSLIFLFTILFFSNSIYASPDASNIKSDKRSGWSVYFDNDGFSGNSDDRGYSGGLSVSVSGDIAKASVITLDPILHFTDDSLGLSNNSLLQLSSIETGLTVFTPDTTSATEPLFNERPYASLIYLSNNRSQVDVYKRSAITSSFTLGVLGLKVAGELQNSLHKRVGASTVDGWNNQISAGGELTFRYSIAKQTILMSNYNSEHIDFELTDTSKLNAGYLTDA